MAEYTRKLRLFLTFVVYLRKSWTFCTFSECQERNITS